MTQLMNFLAAAGLAVLAGTSTSFAVLAWLTYRGKGDRP